MRPLMTIEYAREVLKVEAEAIQSLISRLDDSFLEAVETITACQGHLVITGMGKAGLIGQKASATFASTGTPSFFLHPAEAYHGDLGRVVKDDVVLALSNSGTTEEMLRLLPPLRKIGAKIIAITASGDSPLGKLSDITLEMGKIEEACPLGLAPSASTTATLALTDALGLCVQKRRGFDKDQFAFYHPGGKLGRELQKVQDVMRTGERNPVVSEETPVLEAIGHITRARAGAISVSDRDGKLAGFFTDGDLRRLMNKGSDSLSRPIKTVMTRNPITIPPDHLAEEALRFLREKKIDELPVVDETGKPIGMLDVQDLLDVEMV